MSITHDPINHPTHYTSHPSGIECISITRHLPFSIGNSVKYVWRADLKNGEQDLSKAEFYLEDALSDGMYTHGASGVLASYRNLSKVTRLLDDVIAHEPDERRSRFYRDIRDGVLTDAVVTVRSMMAEVSA